MEFLSAELLLKHPAARLFRAQSAAFVLAFLHTSFHEAGATSVMEDSLLLRLERWLEDRRSDETFTWERSAREYLEEWCSDACGWLRKVASDGALGAQFELTAAAERALRWVDELRGAQKFVGTESRMEGIFRELDELLRYASGDKQARLDFLQAERARIDAEIVSIERTGEVQSFEPWQVNERYARVVESARSLLSDFAQVEENFRRIAQEVVERQTATSGTKGELLGRVLDSHDDVRESPQGRSFYGFVRLLLDPERRERFEAQVANALNLPALAPELQADRLLPRLLPRLRAQQEKVSASTQRLTSNLRRAMESARLAERRRVRELVGEIQRLALCVREAPPRRDGFFEIEELLSIYAGMSRPIWDESATVSLATPLTAGATELDWEKLVHFQGLPHLSLEALAKNVAVCLADHEFVLLTEVLGRFQPKYGLLEVLGYLILASREPRRHYFAREKDEITTAGGARWRLPRVMFCRESLDSPTTATP